MWKVSKFAELSFCFCYAPYNTGENKTSTKVFNWLFKIFSLYILYVLLVYHLSAGTYIYNGISRETEVVYYVGMLDFNLNSITTVSAYH